MPSSGTHITIVQILALDPAFQSVLGDPNADQNLDPDGFLRSRYANLGAMGPDIFFGLADYEPGLQRWVNLYLKIAGTFECMGTLFDELDEAINSAADALTGELYSSISVTFGLVGAIIKEGFLATLVDNPPDGLGVNFFPFFEPPRQRDRPREEWYWTDYLHYIRTGQFTQKLLELSKASNDPNLQAYALGYVTHYVADVVGHPYVNQIVQAPWRLYWQRHRLVENFIDGYTWPTWHLSAAAPGDADAPPDQVTNSVNDPADGAPYAYSRLHNFISIADYTLGDPIDEIVHSICETIKEGVGDALSWVQNQETETAEIKPPDDVSFGAWAELVSEAMRQTYPTEAPFRSPKRLGGDGIPSSDDVGATYAVFRMLMKMVTEEEITEPVRPEFPDLSTSDVMAVVQAIEDALGGLIPSLPTLGSDLDITELLAELGEWAVHVAEAVITVANALFELIEEAALVLTYPVRYALYQIQRLLYAMYRSFRLVLVMHAYSVPLTSDITLSFGSFETSNERLWQSQGNPAAVDQLYPAGEVAEERDMFRSTYSPVIPPLSQPDAPVEFPNIDWTAPYPADSLPEAFIGALGAASHPEMFNAATPIEALDPSWRGDFGGALENCAFALETILTAFAEPGPFVLPSGFELPDYNLDGDRGYGWPSWDVDPEVAENAPESMDDPGYDTAVPEPLSPFDPRNDPTVDVNAIAVDQ